MKKIIDYLLQADPEAKGETWHLGFGKVTVEVA